MSTTVSNAGTHSTSPRASDNLWRSVGILLGIMVVNAVIGGICGLILEFWHTAAIVIELSAENSSDSASSGVWPLLNWLASIGIPVLLMFWGPILSVVGIVSVWKPDSIGEVKMSDVLAAVWSLLKRPLTAVSIILAYACVIGVALQTLSFFADRTISFDDGLFKFEYPAIWRTYDESTMRSLRVQQAQQTKQMYLQYKGSLEEYEKFQLETPHMTGVYAQYEKATVIATVMKSPVATTFLEHLGEEAEDNLQIAIKQGMIRDGSVQSLEVNGMSAVRTEIVYNEGKIIISYVFNLPAHPDRLFIIHMFCESELYSKYETVFNHIIETLRIVPESTDLP